MFTGYEIRFLSALSCFFWNSSPKVLVLFTTVLMLIVLAYFYRILHYFYYFSGIFLFMLLYLSFYLFIFSCSIDLFYLSLSRLFNFFVAFRFFYSYSILISFSIASIANNLATASSFFASIDFNFATNASLSSKSSS